MIKEIFNNLLKELDGIEEDTSADSLERDLLATSWLISKVCQRGDYAQNLYAALCNNEFQRNDVWPILQGQVWSCTWRYAGGIIADMRGQGDYMDWYCSGMIQGHPDDDTDHEADKGYVPEGIITDEIKDDLYRIGWIPSLNEDH